MFDGCEVLFDVEGKVLLAYGKAKGTLYVGTGASGWTVLPGEWDGVLQNSSIQMTMDRIGG